MAGKRQKRSRKPIPDDEWDSAVRWARTEVRRLQENPAFWQNSVSDILEFLVRRGEGAEHLELVSVLGVLHAQQMKRSRAIVNRRADLVALAAISVAETFNVAQGRNSAHVDAKGPKGRSANDAAVVAAHQEGIVVTYEAVRKSVKKWKGINRKYEHPPGA